MRGTAHGAHTHGKHGEELLSCSTCNRRHFCGVEVQIPISYILVYVIRVSHAEKLLDSSRFLMTGHVSVGRSGRSDSAWEQQQLMFSGVEPAIV